jgi:hypothetical protein
MLYMCVCCVCRRCWTAYIIDCEPLGNWESWKPNFPPVGPFFFLAVCYMKWNDSISITLLDAVGWMMGPFYLLFISSPPRVVVPYARS